MTQPSSAKGFTLVELMLAMTFIGILLVGILMTSLHIMGTYTKGITIKELNQSGRAIADDMQRTIAAVPRFDVIPKTGDPDDPPNSNYVIQDGGGRLCTGTYTYAWNYGNTAELSGATSTPVYNTFSDSDEVIRLVKVNDVGRALCRDMSREIERSQAKDLLAAAATVDGDNFVGDRNLAVQALRVSLGVEDTASGQALYSIHLVLGTNDQDQLNATSTHCLPPGEGSDREDFCAINQFSIIARAGNRSGSL